MEALVISSKDVKRAITAALTRAWHCSLDKDHDLSLGQRHRARSKRFIREVGCMLDERYHCDSFEVHWKREGCPVHGRGEVLHDFDVFKVDEDGILRTNIWQIESEFAYLGRNPLNPRPRKKKLIEDLNKLISGCAENSLLVTSIEWMNDEKQWFLSTMRKAATQWDSLNNTKVRACFYVALIPFVSKWHSLKKNQLNCSLMTFNLDTGNYEFVD